MLRNENKDDIAYKRNSHEFGILSELLNLNVKVDILDIGCGLGRMYLNFKDAIRIYDGIDFSKNYVDFANENYGSKSTCFHRMSAEDIDKTKLQERYDIIIVNGLCVYINDDGVTALLETVNNLSSENTKLYFRESISTINKRLTLKDFKSDELNTDYHAIYRTSDEYDTILGNSLTDFENIKSDLLLDEALGARAETNQRYWFMIKKAL